MKLKNSSFYFCSKKKKRKNKFPYFDGGHFAKFAVRYYVVGIGIIIRGKDSRKVVFSLLNR